MEETLTARQFALDTGRPPRTVQQWAEAEGNKGEASRVRKQLVPGSIRPAWIASRATWEALAEEQRGRGRPRKTEPQEP